MYFGGCKNYLGHSKICSYNVITYPGVNGRSAGDRRCQTDDNGVFADQYHQNNTCFVSDGGFYSFSNCNINRDLNSTVYVTGRNQLFSDQGHTFSLSCPSSVDFSAWQRHGQDAGSVVGITPSIASMIAQGMAVLGISV
jgi:hypothetical protein